MERSFLYLLHALLSVALVLLVTGCAEDPRFSANTQYLGGGYGGGAGGPPRDTVSYWDGDHASGSPSIKISLGEQRAYFYKGGVLVGVSQLSTGREGLNTPAGNYKIIQKDKDHFSTLFGDYVDSSGKVVVANIDDKKGSKTARHTLPRHADALLYADRVGDRVACRLFAGLSGLAWLHPHAGIHGGKFL